MKIIWIWIWIWRLQLKKLIWFCLHFHWWRKKIFWICTIICGLVKCIFEFFKRIWFTKNQTSHEWKSVFFSSQNLYFFLTVFILYLLIYSDCFQRKWFYNTLHVSNLTLNSAILRIPAYIDSPGSVTYVSPVNVYGVILQNSILFLRNWKDINVYVCT